MAQAHECSTCEYLRFLSSDEPCNSCAIMANGTKDHWIPRSIGQTTAQIADTIHNLDTEILQLRQDKANLKKENEEIRKGIKYWKDKHNDLLEKHKKTEIEMEEAKKRYDECMEIYKNHADANNADGLKTLLEAYRTVLKDVLSVDAAR